MNTFHAPRIQTLVVATFVLLVIGPVVAQRVSPPPDEGTSDKRVKAVPTSEAKAAPANDPERTDPAVMLSPFEVVAESQGYYGASTMSGTRLNSDVGDLASSITVMTKEQMRDFAMIDINDVLLYTAGTEGSGTYTALTIDTNGSVADDVELNPTNANRIRGLGPANTSLGNFETMGRVPVDPIAVDAIEISRGPNANIFGLGNPSGTVNQVPASANLTRNSAELTIRGDTYGGFRETLDVNRVVLKNKLAVRAAEVFQHEGYVRKPSGVNTVRYYGMVKYSPFKSTTISGSFSYYRLNGTRPNFQPPRDYISYWLANGKPTWDPVTQVIHVNGTTLGPFTADTNLPDYFNRSSNWSSIGQLYVDRGGVTDWTAPQTTLAAPVSATRAIAASGTVRLMGASGSAGSRGNGVNAAQPFFATTPPVTDRGIYDWSSINFDSVNEVMDRTLTTNVQINQTFVNTPRHLLAAQLGFMREDSLRWQRIIVGALSPFGQQGELMVDVNERKLDGTPNPFLLRPYIGERDPLFYWQPAKWDNYRAQLAYKLDLTGERGWGKFLGRHMLNGYNEYKYRVNRQYAFEDGMTSSNAWLPPGSHVNQGAVPGGATVGVALARTYARFYLGDNVDHNIDYAPSKYAYGNYPFTFGNSTTGFVRDPSSLGLIATTGNTGGASNSKVIMKTSGAVLQSHLAESRIVTTFGVREDKQYFKGGSTPQQLNPDGISFVYDSLNHWAPDDYSFGSGKTKTGGVVLRPFRGWTGLDRAAREASGLPGFAAGVLRGLSLTYNRSNSFLPAGPGYNMFLNRLPNPGGYGKDYGIGLNLFGGKVVVRANHYEDRQADSRAGNAGTISLRLLRMELPYVSTVAYCLQVQSLAWVAQQHPDWNQQQIQTEAARQMQYPWDEQNELNNRLLAGQVASTNDVLAKGTELEINFNPNRFWTVAASATDMRSYNSNVSGDIATWIAQRLPVWTAIIDPRTNTRWWVTNYGGSVTAEQNFIANIQGPFALILAKQGQSNPSVRRYNFKLSTKYRLAGRFERSFLRNVDLGGALRWEDKGAIGYYGTPAPPAIVTALDVNRPIWDKGHTYVDAFVGYHARLFRDRIPAHFRFNVRNLQEGGRLQPIAAFPDGVPSAYRIVDPRQFIAQVTFDL